MQNFDTAVKATATSLNSAGSAEKENEKVMQGLEKTIQKLKAQFEILINGDGGLKAFMVSVVKLGADTLKLINSLGGLPTILMGILSVLLLIKGEAITKMIVDAVKAIPNLISSLANLKVAYSTTGKSIKIFSSDVATSSSILHASIPIIGLVMTGITLLTGVINKHKQSQEEANRKTQEAIEKNREAIKSNNQAIESLKNESLTRDELNIILDNNFDKYEAERLKLLDINDARQEAIDLLKEENKERLETENLIGRQQFEKAVGELEAPNAKVKKFEDFEVDPSISTTYDLSKYEEGIKKIQESSTLDEVVKNRKEYLKTLYEIREEILDADNYSAEFMEDFNEYIYQQSDALAKDSEKLETNNKLKQDYIDKQAELGYKLNETGDDFVEMSKAEKKVYDVSKMTNKEIDEAIKNWSDEDWSEYADGLGVSVEEARATLLGLKDSLNDTTEDAKTFGETLEDMSFEKTSLDGLHSSFTALNDALTELNETGQLSYDKFNALMSQSDEYILALFDENGQLRENADIQKELYEAKVQQMSADKALSMIRLASKYQEENGTLEGYKDTIKSTTDATWGLVNAEIAEMKARATSEHMKAVNEARQSRAGTYTSYDDYVSSNKSWAGNEAERKYQEEMEAINNYAVNIKESIKDLGDDWHYWETSSKEGHGGATKEIKKEDDALKELENEYKDAVKEVKDAINKEIDKIKEAKDAEINAIKDRISALEKQKDKEIKAVEDRIKALQKARDAEEKYWDDKIDALKAQNKEQERQNELMKLEEELAKARAKNVMVLGESGHFELRKDDTEVQKAEEALEKKQEEIAYEKKLEELENYKQQALANYDAQIADLESYKDKLEENYNAQIEALKAFQDEREKYYDQQTEALKAQLDELQSSLEDYVDIENKKAEAGADATNSEAKTWNQRLSNLADFVNKYNSLMKKLGDGSTNNKGGGLGTSYSADAISSGNKKEVKGKKATGDSYISEDGAYLVGDDPNKEIIIGSKLNGSLMSLSKGSGVVNAKSTNTLAGVLNQLGSFSRSNFGSGNGTLVNNSNSNAQNITIGSISLPEVKNGKDFVDYLQNFSLNMKQMSFA